MTSVQEDKSGPTYEANEVNFQYSEPVLPAFRPYLMLCYTDKQTKSETIPSSGYRACRPPTQKSENGESIIEKSQPPNTHNTPSQYRRCCCLCTTCRRSIYRVGATGSSA